MVGGSVLLMRLRWQLWAAGGDRGRTGADELEPGAAAGGCKKYQMTQAMSIPPSAALFGKVGEPAA